MGIHITNAAVILHKSSNKASSWILEASASEIHADGTAGGPAKALVFSANMVDTSARIILEESKDCLMEVSCNILVEGTVKADGPLNVEVIAWILFRVPNVQFFKRDITINIIS